MKMKMISKRKNGPMHETHLRAKATAKAREMGLMPTPKKDSRMPGSTNSPCRGNASALPSLRIPLRDPATFQIQVPAPIRESNNIAIPTI